MDDTESAVYFEVVGAIQGDYQDLCQISDKLSRLENRLLHPASFDSQRRSGPVEFIEAKGEGQRPWEVWTCLMKLSKSEVCLCKRLSSNGIEYGIVERLPEGSAYAKANGACDVLATSDNMGHLFQDYCQNERRTLQLMASNIIANVRQVMSERFVNPQLRHVVHAISHACKQAATLDLSKVLSELPSQAQHRSQSVRI